MVVLLRMPSLDRAGPKNGEPYGVWQFKRTVTMYCCMQWVIALSFLGNAAYDLFLLYFVEGDEWVLIYAKNISGEILIPEAPAIVLEHAVFMVFAAIVEIIFFFARLRVRRWADQGRARQLIAAASGLMSIIVLIFEIRVITVEPIVRTIYSPIAMVLVALTIGTLGLPLKGQIAFLLTYAGASKWMSPRDATAPQSGRQLPFPTAHREFFWIAAGSPPFRIHPSQGGREGKRGAGVPCIFPHARNAGRTGGYGASMRMSH